MTGLLTPFRRDRKSDIASGSGEELLKSKIEQILMTEGRTPYGEGELPWRTDYGSIIHMLRHHQNSDVAEELARVWVRDALRRWLSGVGLAGIKISKSHGEFHVSLHFENCMNQAKRELLQLEIEL